MNSGGGAGGVGVGVGSSGGGGGGIGTMGSGGGMVAMRGSSPFTVSQYQELEHQALIYKYILAGIPVPPELVLPIQKSFEAISHRFFHYPTMGYCSFYGKKIDPEPGRCRRTDGKKWRCSKDAYPDSKYCERHMHRGRNRSRKPVESQPMTQSSSSATSVTVTGTSVGTGSFQNLTMQSFSNPQGTGSRNNQSQYGIESIPYGIPSRDYRYMQGLKPEVSEYSFFSEASGSNRSLHVNSQLDSTWPLMQSRTSSSFPVSKSTGGSMLQNDYPQQSFVSGEFAAEEPVKLQDCQSLRPFFDEWPKTRETWSGLEDDRSNQTSVSTTQLSISIPMASPDFSTTSSRSRSPRDT